MCKVAFLYDLYVEHKIADLLEKIETYNSKEKAPVLQEIWYYYTSVCTFYHIVSGQSLKEQHETALKQFMPDYECVWEYDQRNRFQFSTQYLVYLGGVLEFTEGEQVSILQLNQSKLKDSKKNVFGFVKKKITNVESFDLNCGELHQILYDRINDYKEDFKKQTNQGGLKKYKFKTADSIYELVNSDDIEAWFQNDGTNHRLSLRYDTNETLEEIKMFFNKKEFEEFPSRINTIGNMEYCAYPFINAQYNRNIDLYERELVESNSSKQSKVRKTTRKVDHLDRNTGNNLEQNTAINKLSSSRTAGDLSNDEPTELLTKSVIVGSKSSMQSKQVHNATSEIKRDDDKSSQYDTYQQVDMYLHENSEFELMLSEETKQNTHLAKQHLDRNTTTSTGTNKLSSSSTGVAIDLINDEPTKSVLQSKSSKQVRVDTGTNRLSISSTVATGSDDDLTVSFKESVIQYVSQVIVDRISFKQTIRGYLEAINRSGKFVDWVKTYNDICKYGRNKNK